MGLLGEKESKEDKRERKMQEMLAKYGLQDLTDPKDKESVRTIAYNLMGNNMIQLGLALSGNGLEAAKMSYMNALVEQNFIIIRQLDKIANKL